MQVQGYRRGQALRSLARRPAAVLCLALALAAGPLWLQACSSDETTSSLASTTTTAPAPLASGAIGQEMAIAGWKITVDAVESKTEVDGTKAAEGKELLVVSFTVLNVLSRPVSLTAEDLSLRGEAGSSYRAVDTGTGLYALAPIPANGSGSSFVVFSVPTGATGLKLHFSPFIEAQVSPREADITLR